jgi:hypothetical protein
MPHAQNLGIGRHEPPHVGGVVAGAEEVEAGFGVAFFAGEFVVLGAGVGSDHGFGSEGVVIRVVAGSGLPGLDDFARGAEVVGEIVEDIIGIVAACDALATEENALVERGVVGIASGIGFVERVGARAVPVELAVGFPDALAIAIVRVGNPGGGAEVVLVVISYNGAVESFLLFLYESSVSYLEDL